MTTSLASQLQKLKSVVKADADPLKRPFTRPSILYNPKEAADLNNDEIFSIGLQGLEVLIDLEGRFRDYKNDLFSVKSGDRELMGIVENEKINVSICSYLRLMSGYFKKPAARMTLEYLIRRYKIHVYNVEELILCTLPYHDTHEFVRVVQLIDTGNSRWKFLDGVKTSGAPLPRKVIVQQCVRDPGVLKALCDYATASKKIQPSRPVIAFCTAVVIEVLGCNTTIDNDTVNKIISYVVSGLKPSDGEKMEQKAGSLMIVGLLAQRVALSYRLVRILVREVAELAREVAKMSIDFQWFRMSVIALINLVQSQHMEEIPKKIIDILTEARDIPKILCGLISEFNVDVFLAMFMDSLLMYSSSDKNCHQMLMAMIETVPLKDHADSLVTKLLKICQRLSKSRDNCTVDEIGDHGKQILESFHKKYPVELREAVRKALQCGKWGSLHEFSDMVLHGDLDFSTGTPYSKIWFALQHPKAEVRRSALTGLDVTALLSDNDTDPKGLNIIQDAIVSQLKDDDLSVVGAVLTVKRLNELINPQVLLGALQNVLKRCIWILMETSSNAKSLASDVAVACLELLVISFKDQDKYAQTLATTIFPFVLVLSKAQRINLKALELSKEVRWSSYQNLMSLSKLDKGIISVNSVNISKLAEDFLARPKELIHWLVECCDTFQLSRTLFFLILLESFMMAKKDGQFFELFDDFFRILRSHWESLESAGNIQFPDEGRLKMLLDWDCKRFLEHLDTSSNKLNSEILICLFHRWLEAFVKTVPSNVDSELWLSKLEKPYIFFASRLGHDFLVLNYKIFSPKFLAKMFTGEGISVRVQAESLFAFSRLCSQSKDNMDGNRASVLDLSSQSDIQLLHEFPSVLVPLASDDRDVRTAAMSCIEGMFDIWSRRSLSSWKNGARGFCIHFLGELLGLLVQQKRLILSDGNFLQSLFESLLISSSDNLLMQETVRTRLDQVTKEEILNFLLVSPSLSPYGKLKMLSLLRGLGSKILEINAIKLLLHDLLKRHQHTMCGKSSQKLSVIEVNILCLLLESCMKATSTFEGNNDDGLILKILALNEMPSEDGVILKPCLTLLRNLNSSLFDGLKTETQEYIFHHLVILFRNENSCIQNAAREALLLIDVSCSVLTRMLDSVLDHINCQSSATHVKKAKTTRPQGSMLDVFQGKDSTLSYISSLLDVLLLKKNMNRSSLLPALFKLGKFLLDGEEVNKTMEKAELYIQASSGHSQTTSCREIYIQQELLVVLEDICSSLINDDLKECVTIDQFDLEFLVKCARSSKNAVTRNHVFSLFCTLSKIIPDKVLDHILDILIIAGESVITQWDRYSRHVFEDLVSAVVPFWVSKTGDVEKMMQIFVDILPQVAENERLSIVVHLLRNFGESSSFGLMIFFLFRTLVLRTNLLCKVDKDPSLNRFTSFINGQWEYLFAKQLSEQYSCTIWLPSMVLLLQKIGGSTLNKEFFVHLIVSMQYVLEKLLDPEIAFMIDAGEDIVMIQATTGALMEQVICILLLIDSNRKHIGVPSVSMKKLKENMHTVLKTIARGLSASSYFKVIIQFLRHVDKNARKKALGLLCETVKETCSFSKHHERNGSSKILQKSSWFHFDETTQITFHDMCLEILKLADNSGDDPADVQLKLAAISTLQILAKSFPSYDSVSSKCLYSVSRNICSKNPAVSSACLHATGALIDVLGPRALSELAVIMKGISLCVKEETTKLDGDTSSAYIKLKDSFLISVFVSLEALVDKLGGGLLSPYLSDILELLVLHPSVLEVKLKAKVDVVRKLVIEKFSVRLLLPRFLRLYTEAVRSGESSLSIMFEMLGNIVGSMNKSDVADYHVQIFDLCMLALDLRSQRPASVKHAYVVEEKVTNCLVILTSKLSEIMFKPLFYKSIEWSRSHVEESEPYASKTIGRAISFYGLVNQLAETFRSLFVPYFKDLCVGCMGHLTDVEDTSVGLTQKRKKAKLQSGSTEKRPGSGTLTLEAWHLRALILSYLHKCFLYASGNLEFPEAKEAQGFKVLVKAVVSQLVMDPPSFLDQHPDIPSLKDVDDLLIACLGQMAVFGGSGPDLVHLNNELMEVLEQARNGGVRGRILGLRIVKHLVENLKEEYVAVDLPKAFHVLGEFLEDVELPVKTLVQEIIKEMESLSGESFQDYI